MGSLDCGSLWNVVGNLPGIEINTLSLPRSVLDLIISNNYYTPACFRNCSFHIFLLEALFFSHVWLLLFVYSQLLSHLSTQKKTTHFR